MRLRALWSVANDLRPFCDEKAKERMHAGENQHTKSPVEKIPQANRATKSRDEAVCNNSLLQTLFIQQNRALQSRDEAGEKGRFIIMEISSNNKPKRGRPKGFMRKLSDCSKQYLPDQLSKRGELHYSLFVCFAGAISKADEATQLRILGSTWQDMKNGNRFPLGLRTASIEIGRWIGYGDGSDERKKLAVELVDQLLTEKRSWREIQTHFKERRIGTRTGNSLSIVHCLTRAINDYLGKHPSTTQKTVDHAIKMFYVLNLPINKAEAQAEALHLAGAIKGTKKTPI